MKISCEKMKILVTYYSRSGNTKNIAKEISKKLNSDIDEIIDLKDRSGIRGFLGAGWDVFFKKPTKIKNKINPEDYDLVIIGTPIWVGRCAPAIKTYLINFKLKNKIAFFCTAGSKQSSAFNEMERLSKKPLAVMDIKDKKVKSGDYREKLNEFLGKLK